LNRVARSWRILVPRSSELAALTGALVRLVEPYVERLDLTPTPQTVDQCSWVRDAKLRPAAGDREAVKITPVTPFEASDRRVADQGLEPG
jgi:hypothetical protein